MTISWFRTLFTAVLVAVVLVPVSVGAQVAPACGNIVDPDNYWYDGFLAESSPIEDCANPLGRTGDLTNFLINSTPVLNNGSFIIASSGLMAYGIAGENYYNKSSAEYYRHDGPDFIRVDTSFSKPTTAEINAKIGEFFNNDQAQTDYYKLIYWSSYSWPYFYSNGGYTVDARRGERTIDVFNQMVTYIKENTHTNRPPLMPGTYTVVLVDTDEGPVMNYNNLWQNLFAWMIPTAHAYYYVNTVTFTLVAEPPAPTGASSVLFLPGIQASRLYAGQDLSGVAAYERVWEPGNNSDVQALAMTVLGESVYDIYTQDILKTITVDVILGYQKKVGDIYAGFSNFMDSLVTDGTIHEWYPFAYDWRYDVFDVVQNGTIVNQAGTREYPADTVEFLASHSLSNKVTIIAHSNGGLLAKALMIELEKVGKADLVDRIIFIGTPQLGTPKAIGTILHGYDQEQGGGFVIKDTVARGVINNLPGAYNLLPAEQYINQTDIPIISFDTSASTATYRGLYGNSIADILGYNNFLVGDTSENRGLGNKIYEPASANSFLLETALSEHKTLLDDWVAPSSTKIVSIVGTGLPTMKAIRYVDTIEDICPPNTIISTLSACTLERKPRPQAILSHFGDGTVTSLSAKGYAGVGDEYFVDLKSISSLIEGITFDHSNFTETSYVQDLVENLLSTTTIPSIPFIFNQEPVVVESYTIQQIASPVFISSTDSSGRSTGLVEENGMWILKEDIPGSQYFEFAGTKYLVTPADTDLTTKLTGQNFGGYSYTISTVSTNDIQTQTSQIQNASTSPAMVASIDKVGGQFGNIQIDLDGNGTIDQVMTTAGEIIGDDGSDDNDEEDEEDEDDDEHYDGKDKKDKRDSKHKKDKSDDKVKPKKDKQHNDDANKNKKNKKNNSDD